MKPTVTLTAFFLVGLSVALHAATLVGPVINPANHHSYFLLEEDSWQNSEAQAVDLGGHLVTINDQAEQDWVFSTFGSYGGTNRGLWIGLREGNVEGNYQWSSGESVDYSHWLPGQPDNSLVTSGESYVHMLNSGNEYGHPGGFWNDLASPNTGFPTFNPLCGVVEVIDRDSPVISVRLSSLEICWAPLSNRLYQVEYCSDLAVNRWIALGSPMLGNGSTRCVVDEVPQGQSHRFYRVVLLP